MTKIKVCGIKTLDDALFAAEAGADMLGFAFVRNSPHSIDKDAARTICKVLREKLDSKCPILVGSFINELVSNISSITNYVGLDAAQMNGDESDVMLKERRPLILVPRETPFNTIHLENLLRLSQAGAVILPAMPGFYHGPGKIDDLVDFVVGKVLDQLDIQHSLFARWGAEQD